MIIKLKTHKTLFRKFELVDKQTNQQKKEQENKTRVIA